MPNDAVEEPLEGPKMKFSEVIKPLPNMRFVEYNAF